jgi:hypothetical protein
MSFAELHQRLRRMLRCRHIKIGDDAAFHGLGIIEIDGFPHEVGAIGRHQFVGHSVWARIVGRHEFVVLSSAGLDLKAVQGPIVSRAHQLIPIATRGLSRFLVGHDLFKIFSAILVAQSRFQLAVRKQGNTFGFLDPVEVGIKGNREPVVTTNPVVAADHHARFAGLAASQGGWRRSAHLCQVHGGVTSSGEGPVVAVRLLQEDGNIRAGARGHP